MVAIYIITMVVEMGISTMATIIVETTTKIITKIGTILIAETTTKIINKIGTKFIPETTIKLNTEIGTIDTDINVNRIICNIIKYRKTINDYKTW